MFVSSLFSVFPFIYTRELISGIISGILYILFCISISIFITTICADVLENHTVKGVSSIILVVFALVLINLNYSFLIQNNSLYTWAGTSRVLLWNRTTESGLLSDVHTFSPSS
jgi:hypothetical protein